MNITYDDQIYADLSNHAINCDHPLRACLLCRARAEMERRAGDVDAVRFERDDARSRVALFYTVMQQTLTPLVNAAQQLINGEGIRTEGGAGDELPRVPDEVFDKIQSAAHNAINLRYAERRLWEAHERLYRINSAHARHAGRAVVTRGIESASARRVAAAIADAWYGPGWEGDPLAPLDMYPLEVPGA